MTAQLIGLEQIPLFAKAGDISPNEVTDQLRASVKALHESEDIEEFVRAILSDRAATPHGPAEIVDILTHRIEISGTSGWAAFILKGRSFKTVRPADISHQIYRIEKIAGLKVAILGATGVVLDGVKEQFSSTCERLGVQYCFMDVDDFARLFWAYGFLCPRDGRRISGGRCTCGYAPKSANLNVLQTEALKELSRVHELRQPRGLVILPPGTGKTRIAANDARNVDAKSVLYVAHTHEILEVAESEFSAIFGVEQVSLETREAPVSLVTIQYLARHLDELSAKPIDYLVIDEFHHAAAKSYQATIDRLNFGFLLGLTATPFRSDRQDIAQICNQNVVVNYELRAGVDAGILSPYHYYGCFDDVDYSSLSFSNGKYSVRDLERKLIIKERHEAIVRKWREKADGKPSLAFCCSHRHAEKVAEEFNNQGIRAEVYISSTPSIRRKQMVSALERGKTKVLCVVDILNEGADIRFVECLLFLRPTESKRIFFQQLGRGLRKDVGKTQCIVIDFIGNFRNAHRLVEFHGLRPEETESRVGGLRSLREILDLPIGCKVEFEDRVLDIFAREGLDPRTATRQNISRILIYQYERLRRRLDRMPTKKDVDRGLLFGRDMYESVFGSWKRFIDIFEEFYLPNQ
ncbi:DEAD/DEAH box helicase family protein [Dongia rigui]|uniref:DEAD/DEAH box helicase family protein n=2 Tax=Dongia rigui TaxID=940149 RepID=A0ABU5DWB5_9PROT|nr:DEAD/DEAH box helicase family protein [Dongia rigui]